MKVIMPVSLILTMLGLAVTYGEHREKTSYLERAQAADRVAISNVKSEVVAELKEVRSEIRAVEQKSELPVRLDERMKAMQEQLDRIERRSRRW